MIMRYFSVKEANSILPQIKVLVEEIVEKREEIYKNLAIYEELKEVENLNKIEQLELLYAKSMVKLLDDEIKELVETIQNFGVLVKSIDPVVLDFPAKNEDEDIFLCWKEDEEQILFWHGIYEGFNGRKPISLLAKNQKRFF